MACAGRRPYCHSEDAKIGKRGGAAAMRRILMKLRKQDPVAFFREVMAPLFQPPPREQPLSSECSKEESVLDILIRAEEHRARYRSALSKKSSPVTGDTFGASNGSQAA